MEIAVIGVTDYNTPLTVREKVHFTESHRIEALEKLLSRGLSGCVILSTCNRTEMYLSAEEGIDAAGIGLGFLKEFAGTDEIEDYAFSHRGRAVAEHLFSVAAGLDSAVVGEDQILGQVKDAAQVAMEVGAAGKVLSKLFREAVTWAKEIKTRTHASDVPVSLSYIGIKELNRAMGGLTDKTVLLSGLGEMGRLALTYLLEGGARVYIAIRQDTQRRSEYEQLAHENQNITLIPYEKLADYIPMADGMVTATAAPHLVIEAEDVMPRQKPICFLDLGLPRDVDSRVRELAGVTLIDLDDLRRLSRENEEQRRNLLMSAKDSMEEKINEFFLWEKGTLADETIQSLQERMLLIRDDTMEYLKRKLTLSHREEAILEKMLLSNMKRLLREPFRNLKQTREEEKLRAYVDLLQELFRENE